MKLQELKNGVQEYLYMEDTGVVDLLMASVLASRIVRGTPVWVVVIGASSSGKSQLLRPIALADDKFVHRIDDLTENSFISGSNTKKGEKKISILNHIGTRGVLLISDLTVLFSRNTESRDAILGQLRMIHDGRFVRHFGNQTPISWEGTLGLIAGCTPSLYRYVERISDLGERFVYYRMKNVDPRMATTKALSHMIPGKELDLLIASLYDTYQKTVIKSLGDTVVPPLSERTRARLMESAVVGTKLRTPVFLDQKTYFVLRIPSPESPPRVAKELQSIALGFSAMQYHETKQWELSEDQLLYLDWCAYSLANEERRAVLNVMRSGGEWSTQRVADNIGLSTEITKSFLQQLTAIDVCERAGEGNKLMWKIKDQSIVKFLTKFHNINDLDVKLF